MDHTDETGTIPSRRSSGLDPAPSPPPPHLIQVVREPTPEGEEEEEGEGPGGTREQASLMSLIGLHQVSGGEGRGVEPKGGGVPDQGPIDTKGLISAKSIRTRRDH